MQEFRYFRDGATLVISLDCFNWLSKRRRSDPGIQKRDEELQLLVSSRQTIQDVEKLLPIICFCILDRTGSRASHLFGNRDCRGSLAAWPPIRCPSSAFSASQCQKESPWTRLFLNMPDIFSFLKEDLGSLPRQDAVTNKHNGFFIFCNEDIPPQLFGDTEDCRTSVGGAGRPVCEDNMLSDVRNSKAHRLLDPNNNDSPEGILHDLGRSDNLNTRSPKGLLKSCQICTTPGLLSGRDRNLKKRKRVSFDDDVIVFLFDQESPTLELHHGACTSLPSSSSCSLPEATLEDSGLEWEDDFSALEKSCHLESVRRSLPRHYGLSLPTQSSTALSRHLLLSQTCLFLTHVTESDLEL